MKNEALPCFDEQGKVSGLLSPQQNDNFLGSSLRDRRSADAGLEVEIEIAVFRWWMRSDSRRGIQFGVAVLRRGASYRLALLQPLDSVTTGFGSLCSFSRDSYKEG